jgi:hypothetical protein
VEELLAAHQHALTRIAAIYEFFRMFEKIYATDVAALVGEHRDLASIPYVGRFTALTTMRSVSFMCEMLLHSDAEAKPIEELYDAAVRAAYCQRFG